VRIPLSCWRASTVSNDLDGVKRPKLPSNTSIIWQVGYKLKDSPPLQALRSADDEWIRTCLGNLLDNPVVDQSFLSARQHLTYQTSFSLTTRESNTGDTIVSSPDRVVSHVPPAFVLVEVSSRAKTLRGLSLRPYCCRLPLRLARPALDVHSDRYDPSDGPEQLALASPVD
jgi:hypothetical protein